MSSPFAYPLQRKYWTQYWAMVLCLITSVSDISCQDLAQIVQDPILACSQVGVYAVEMSSGAVVAAHNEEALMIPASTQKLLTGITALKQLGDNYRFKTKVQYTGDIADDGTLSGDLLVIGSHDPTLGSDRIDGSPPLDQLLDLLVAKVGNTITCIDGEIIVVSPAPDNYHPYRYWLYEDLGNYYGTPSYPINIQDNTYHVHLSRGLNAGTQCQVQKIEPADLGMTIRSSVAIGRKGSGDQAYILGSPDDSSVEIVGTLPPGSTPYKIKGSIPDPPSYFAQRLHKKLVDSGINSTGYQVVASPPTAAENLTSIQSPTLSKIVTEIHQSSNNLYTEAVYSHLSYPDLTMGPSHKMVDACGLSPMNRISPKLLTTFLYDGTRPNSSVLKTLPVSGVSGTIRSILRDGPYHGHIYAKSGSMSGVLCYAGYMQVDDRWIAFAVMLNNFNAEIRAVKPIAERLMKVIYDY